MFIYNIKTQVKFDLGYNPLIKVTAHLAGASVSYGHISSLILKIKQTNKQVFSILPTQPFLAWVAEEKSVIFYFWATAWK